MQTLTIEIEDNKADILLNLIKNLKDGIVKSYTLTPNTDKNLALDPYFYERQKELHKLRDDVKSGKMKVYDFNDSMDELMLELNS